MDRSVNAIRRALSLIPEPWLAGIAGLAFVFAAAGSSWAMSAGNQLLAVILLVPALVLGGLILARWLVHAPEVFVGLLQGGMGIVWFALNAVGLTIPDGWTLPLFAGLSLLGASLDLIRQGRWRVYLTPLPLLVAGQGLLVVVGVVYSWHADALYKALLFVAGNLVSFVVGVALTRLQRQRIYLVLLVVGVVMALGVLVSFVIAGPGAARGRYGVFGIDTIGASRLIGLGLVVLLFSWQRGQLRIVNVIVLGAGLLLAASRGPLVSLLLTVLVVPFIGTGRIRDGLLARRTWLLVGGLVLALILLVSIQQLNQHITVAENWGPFRLLAETNLADENIQARLQHIRVAVQDFEARPILGWGTAGYGGSTTTRDSAKMNWPHNMTLEILAEQGLVGLAVYVLILALATRAIWRLLAQARRRADAALRAETLLLTALLIDTLLDAHVSGHLGANRTVWLALGLLQGLRFGRST